MISGLTSLRLLNASNNQIATLAPSLSTMSSLVTLDLSDNQLTTGPNDVS